MSDPHSDGSAGRTAAARTPPEAAAAAGAPPAGADLGRRRFFRQFATDVFHTAATVAGAASAFQRGTAEAASAILNGPREDDAGAVSTGPSDPGPNAFHSTSAAGDRIADQARRGPELAIGYHSAFRADGDRIVLVNQHRLPFSLVEVECWTAIDAAHEIRELTVVGGPAVAQVAALSLALTARRIRESRPYARRAIIRAAETTLLQARPTSPQLRAVVARVMARYVEIGEFSEDGDRVADAMQDEADAIIFESNDDHGRIADAAATRIPRLIDRRPGILLIGATGAMAGGQSGTAFGAVQAAHNSERALHVYVLEGRPLLNAGRLTIWELAQAGIPHTLLPDAAAGWLLQSGRVDVVLVGAEAIAQNGDVANDAGTYPVAVLAARHGIPVVVCAPLAAVDLAAPDGAALETAMRPGRDILELSKVPLTLLDTAAFNPLLDVTPADLVAAWATEEGLVEGEFADGLQAALERRARRLPESTASRLLTGGLAAAVAQAPAAAGAGRSEA